MHACTSFVVYRLLNTFLFVLHETKVHRMVLVPAISLSLRYSGALLAPCEDVSLADSTTKVAKANE